MKTKPFPINMSVGQYFESNGDTTMYARGSHRAPPDEVRHYYGHFWLRTTIGPWTTITRLQPDMLAAIATFDKKEAK